MKQFVFELSYSNGKATAMRVRHVETGTKHIYAVVEDLLAARRHDGAPPYATIFPATKEGWVKAMAFVNRRKPK